MSSALPEPTERTHPLVLEVHQALVALNQERHELRTEVENLRAQRDDLGEKVAAYHNEIQEALRTLRELVAQGQGIADQVQQYAAMAYSYDARSVLAELESMRRALTAKGIEWRRSSPTGGS